MRQLVWNNGTPPPNTYTGTGDTVIGPPQFNSGLTPLSITHEGDRNIHVMLIGADGTYRKVLAHKGSPAAFATVLEFSGDGHDVGPAPGVYAVVIDGDGASLQRLCAAGREAMRPLRRAALEATKSTAADDAEPVRGGGRCRDASSRSHVGDECRVDPAVHCRDPLPNLRLSRYGRDRRLRTDAHGTAAFFG